jgi:hypothetical protein
MEVRRVFISHIHEEKPIALALLNVIEQQFEGAVGGRVECFLSSDRFQFLAGEDWLARTRSELSTADTIILMLSEQSLRRHWVNLEAGAAWILGRRIIPAYYSGLSPGDIPRPYSDSNAINLETELYHLLRALPPEATLTPPPRFDDDPSVATLVAQIRSNTQRLSELHFQETKERLRHLLNLAIAEFADRAFVAVRDIGIHAWRIETADNETVMRRFVRARLSHASASPVPEWRKGEGAVGVCWERDATVKVDLRSPEYTVENDDEWQRLPKNVTLGLSRDRFLATTSPFRAIFAVPVKRDEQLIGCLSLNVDEKCDRPLDQLWRVASDLMHRSATEMVQMLRTAG